MKWGAIRDPQQTGRLFDIHSAHQHSVTAVPLNGHKITKASQRNSHTECNSRNNYHMTGAPTSLDVSNFLHFHSAPSSSVTTSSKPHSRASLAATESMLRISQNSHNSCNLCNFTQLKQLKQLTELTQLFSQLYSQLNTSQPTSATHTTQDAHIFSHVFLELMKPI